MNKAYKYAGFTVLALFGVLLVGSMVIMGPAFPFFVYGLAVRLTMSYDTKPPFFARFKAEMEVNGHTVRFDRILECRSSKIPAGMALQDYELFRKIPTYFATTVGAIGTRLPDGSAVMMWIPYYCGSEVTTDEKGNERRIPKSIPPKTIPFMAWAPNADTLESLEIYLTKQYFSEPYSRIKIRNIEVKEAASATRATPPDEFEWFTGENVEGVSLKTDKNYVFGGLLAITASVDAIPEKHYRAKEDKLFLNQLDTSTALKSLDVKSARSLFRYTGCRTPSTNRRFDYATEDLERGESPYKHCTDQFHERMMPTIYHSDSQHFEILWNRRGYVIARNYNYYTIGDIYNVQTINGPDGRIYNTTKDMVDGYFYFKSEESLVDWRGKIFELPERVHKSSMY